MPKSRERKPKPKKRQPSLTRLQKNGWWSRARMILGRPWAIFVETTGVLVALFALWDVYWNTLPEIRAAGPDYSSPFLLPFTVSNPSRLFEMQDVQWFCGIEKIEFVAGSRHREISGISVTEPPIAAIARSEKKNFRCRIKAGAESVSSARLVIWVKFKTAWLPRKSEKTTFIWQPEAKPPRWIEGEL